MNNSKLFFLPALLVSILLFAIGNLKLGLFLNSASSLIFTPLTKPALLGKSLYNQKVAYFLSLPHISSQNREQKVLISHLLWENQQLKQALKDTKTQELLKANYQKTVPLNITQSTGEITATSTHSLNEVKPGMPVVLGNIFLGLISDVTNKTLTITTLENEVFPAIPIKGASGPRGMYRHLNSQSQITNVSSQTPLILGDFVLTDNSDQIPGDLLIGKITKIITNPQEPIQKGEITLYDSFGNNPENVVVIVQP